MSDRPTLRLPPKPPKAPKAPAQKTARPRTSAGDPERAPRDAGAEQGPRRRTERTDRAQRAEGATGAVRSDRRDRPPRDGGAPAARPGPRPERTPRPQRPPAATRSSPPQRNPRRDDDWDDDDDMPSLDGERLSKRVMVELGCSRASAEQAIALGAVSVDGGVVVEPGARARAEQRVAVDRSLLEQGARPATLLLHKPARTTPAQALRLLQARAHWNQDPYTGAQAPGHLARQACEVGLEQAGSGLLVYTQDPVQRRHLQERLEVLEQELMVDVLESVSPEQLHALAQLQFDEALRLPRFKVSLGSQGEKGTRLRFAVKGSHPGLIGFVCKEAGLTLQALHRIRIGRVALGALPAGQWRYLGANERF